MNLNICTAKFTCEFKWFPIYLAPALNQAVVWVSSIPQHNTLHGNAESWRAAWRWKQPFPGEGFSPSVLWEWQGCECSLRALTQKSELGRCLQSLGIWVFSNDLKRSSCPWSINHTLRNDSLESWVDCLPRLWDRSFRLNRDLSLWTCSLWGHMWAVCIYCEGVGKMWLFRHYFLE